MKRLRILTFMQFFSVFDSRERRPYSRFGRKSLEVPKGTGLFLSTFRKLMLGTQKLDKILSTLQKF